MLKQIIMASMISAAAPVVAQNNSDPIGPQQVIISNGRMTPEALWAMDRISSASPSPDGKWIVYQVGYYSVEKNSSRQVLRIVDSKGKHNTTLTQGVSSETNPTWIDGGKRIAFLSGGQLYAMNMDGTERVQLTHSKLPIEDYAFSPDSKKVILIKSLPYNDIIKKNPDDLPKATGRLVTDLNYRHWDHYVEEIAHPFVADVTAEGIGEGTDILQGEPYECPMAPFGGIEQLAWSPDSKKIAYTCRKKTGVEYATSTDSDIYLYNVESQTTENLCKTADFVPTTPNPTKTFATQECNQQQADQNMGYDTNPAFSPDGQYVAWLSMARDGYESDRNRLCVYNLTSKTKTYVTESFPSPVDAFCWQSDSRSFYFTGVWHGCVSMYSTNLEGTVKKLTEGWVDYGTPQLIGDKGQVLINCHSMSHPDDLYILEPDQNDASRTRQRQITNENRRIFSQLHLGRVMERWVATTDGKQEQVWVILPPDFDEKKKYPTLLYCEGGPQSPVSQFWSYRWNFQIMAAHDYVIIAPNRRGLPGYGQEWLEEISGDWTGQCMNDLLSAIDDAANNLPFVDRDRLGAVGASFGGFSVYYLAGHHDKRFKCFIAHDGAFNLESMYTDTEEAWFSNWEYDDAYWNSDRTERASKTYDNSPHRFVEQWDTPILCIHGEKDYRINANQGFGAFNAARLRGVPAELLIFPDENHWVLKPQNGILWQRTFFNWLDRWLKPSPDQSATMK